MAFARMRSPARIGKQQPGKADFARLAPRRENAPRNRKEQLTLGRIHDVHVMQKVAGQPPPPFIDDLGVQGVDRAVYREFPHRRRLIYNGPGGEIHGRQLQCELVALRVFRDRRTLEPAPVVGRGRRLHRIGDRRVSRNGQAERGYDHDHAWRHRESPHRTTGSVAAAILEKGTPSRTTPDGTGTSRRSSIVGIRSTVRSGASGRATLAAIGTSICSAMILP